MKHKQYIILPLLLLLIVGTVMAQDSETAGQIITLKNAIEEQSKQCEEVLTTYRSEATAVIHEEAGNLINMVDVYLKGQTIITLIGIVIASFLGTSLSLAIVGTNISGRQRGLSNKELEKISEGIWNQLKKEQPKKKTKKKSNDKKDKGGEYSVGYTIEPAN